MNFKSFIWLVAASVLSLVLSNSGWQASGNMTDYLPTIRGFIDDAIDDNLDENTIAKNISDRCNAEWDRFWYVFAAWITDPSAEAILYGYAFRSHWYWHNNYNELSRSFVIWKDYNCELVDMAVKTPASFLSGSAATLADWYISNDDPSLADDIWGLAKRTVEDLIASSAGTGGNDVSQFGLSLVVLKKDFQKASIIGCGVSLNPTLSFSHITLAATSEKIYFFHYLTMQPSN